MSKRDALLATIEAVHAAGLDASLWPQALAAVAETMGSQAASLEVFDRRTCRHREVHMFGVPPAAEMAYLDHFVGLNPRIPFVMRQRVGELGWDYKYWDEPTLARDAFYAEFLPRTGVRYFIDGTILSSAEEYGAIVVHRSPKQGHVQQSEIGLMGRLLPHVRQAFDVARRLKGAGDAGRSFERAFDWLADGVALVRAKDAVVYSNQALQAIARRNDIVRLRKGTIEFLAADARAKFDAALGAVRRLRAGQQHLLSLTDFPVVRGSDAPPYLVSVRPLEHSTQEGATAARADAIVFIRDPLGHGSATGAMLREVFGLTEAETSVAMALQSGVPLEKYARTNAVSLNTVYTHLRRIREKTGCHSVADLIRKFAEFRGLLRRE